MSGYKARRVKNRRVKQKLILKNVWVNSCCNLSRFTTTSLYRLKWEYGNFFYFGFRVGDIAAFFRFSFFQFFLQLAASLASVFFAVSLNTQIFYNIFTLQKEGIINDCLVEYI